MNELQSAVKELNHLFDVNESIDKIKRAMEDSNDETFEKIGDLEKLNKRLKEHTILDGNRRLEEVRSSVKEMNFFIVEQQREVEENHVKQMFEYLEEQGKKQNEIEQMFKYFTEQEKKQKEIERIKEVVDEIENSQHQWDQYQSQYMSYYEEYEKAEEYHQLQLNAFYNDMMTALQDIIDNDKVILPIVSFVHEELSKRKSHESKINYMKVLIEDKVYEDFIYIINTKLFVQYSSRKYSS